MGREISPPISIADGDDVGRIFKDIDALRDFAVSERGSWTFLGERINNSKSRLAGLARWPIDRLNNLINVIAEYANNQNNADNLREHVNMVFSQARHKIPISNTPDWQALRLLAQDLPDDSFFPAALTILRRWPDGAGAPPLNNETEWVGLLAAVGYRLGQTKVSAQAHMDALDRLRTEYATLLTEERESFARQLLARDEALAAFEAKSEGALAAQIHIHAEALDRAAQEAQKQLQSHAASHDVAKSEWHSTHNAFVEQMQLKASTTYWSDKRVGHRKRAKMWGGIAAAYAVIATIIMILGIDGEYTRLMQMTSSTPLGAYVALAARGVIISVVVFWVGRILVRMFLSELHLTMDSYERSTMVSTYLALTQDGKIDEKERALVLAPLFRPTADGWVKDDASTDSNFANVLSMLKGK